MTKKKNNKTVRNAKVENNTNFASLKKEVDDLNQRLIQNGLSEALLGGQNLGGSKLSEVDTLFKNSRWYMISNMRQILSEIYIEHGLIQTVVDVPVDDGFRGGISVKTKQLDEDQLHKLETHIKREEDQINLAQAIKWNRLFGGAGIIILTGQEPDTPLDKKTLYNSRLEFRAVDMWELFGDKQSMEGMGVDSPLVVSEFYNYYGTKIHHSRVMVLKGLKAPSFVRPRLRGWGFSIVEALIRSINQYLKATDLTFELLDEFKIDIFKIKGLTDALLQPEGTANIQKRVQLANQQKSYQNAITMDAEDDYIQKQFSFAGLADTMTGIRMQIASDLRMPLTKIFGVSAAGFSSGQDDIENYNAMVESQVRGKTHFDTILMLELRCLQLYDFIPDDLDFERPSLRVLPTLKEEEVKTHRFNRSLQARQSGEITSREFREICNKDELLPMQIDTDDDNLNIDEIGEPFESSSGLTGVKRFKKSSESEVQNSIEQYGLANFKGRRVAVVAIISGDLMLTGKRRDNGLWTSPGGHVEEGESIKDAAIRETFEECGIKFLSNDLKFICEKLVTDPNTNEQIAIFAYKASIPEVIATTINDPDNEVGEWRWVDMYSDAMEFQFENRHAKQNDLIIEKVIKA